MKIKLIKKIKKFYTLIFEMAKPAPVSHTVTIHMTVTGSYSETMVQSVPSELNFRQMDRFTKSTLKPILAFMQEHRRNTTHENYHFTSSLLMSAACARMNVAGP